MSIVLKLQKKCLDKTENLQDLLREAFVISKKLKLKDFEQWISLELHGYADMEQIPDYRRIRQTLKFLNPYHGWQDATVSNDLSEIISMAPILQPIGEIEYIISENNDSLSISIPTGMVNQLQELYNTDCKPGFDINKTQIYGITEQVRNVLLDWTLKLEEDNILGNDDLIFSEAEKEAAKGVHIEHFHGVMGNVDKVGNMSTGENSTNIYNENNISNEIDKLITEVEKLGLQNKEQVIIDLEESKNDNEKAKSVLGSLLGRGAEVASISSVIIGILGLLQ